MLPDLARMRDLVDLLGSPQLSFPSIHLTGTNGKTSTARMIDSLLRAFGLRVGRYTSPHLESVTERISIDGAPATPTVFARAFDDVEPYVELVDSRHPERVTFFELLTAMAFSAFA
nr:dihydrofolate synthase [Micromonospora sp. DSM 115978]